MSTIQADFAPARFSTDALPERERMQLWREEFGRRMFLMDFEPVPGTQFYADMSLRCFPEATVGRAQFSPLRLLRTPELVAAGNDDIWLIAHSSGCIVSQCGREATVGAGNAVVVMGAEALTVYSPAPAELRCVHVPRALLAPLVPSLDDMNVRTIPSNEHSLHFLLNYVRLLEADRQLASPELARLASVHLRDLVTLVLGATREATDIATGRGLRAARLLGLKDYVARHSSDAALTIQSVAAWHRITPRYVQRLFESEGTTFSEFLLNRRLERVYRMLADPRYEAWAISAIAFEAGFGDISYFNRCFRRRFGAPPTRVRGATGRSDHRFASTGHETQLR
jgi:AraC-like DNA-binding protein